MAPVSKASSSAISRVSTGEFCKTKALAVRLDGGNLPRRSSAWDAKIEAQTRRLDQRALLGHVRPQHLAQGFVQQMRGGVIGTGRRASLVVHRATRLASPG